MLIPNFKYQFRPGPKPDTFEEFYENKLLESHRAGVQPGNTERLVRHSRKKTGYAFLYIHGFRASRAEGEKVMDRMAQKYRANLYYVRLPGHGTSPEDQANHSFQELIQCAEEALMMMPLLGEKIIVFGTSMGGMLATYLASRYPDIIHGIVLVSPFYEFVNKYGKITAYPGMISLINLIKGPVRLAGSENDPPPNNRRPGFDDHWYPFHYYRALRPLARLRKFIVRPEVYEKISVPSLMLYYYHTEEFQDTTAEVKSMLEIFSRFGTATRSHQLNRAVNIPNTEHVMMSKYVSSDYARVESEISEFLDDLMGEEDMGHREKTGIKNEKKHRHHSSIQ